VLTDSELVHKLQIQFRFSQKMDCEIQREILELQDIKHKHAHAEYKTQ